MTDTTQTVYPTETGPLLVPSTPRPGRWWHLATSAVLTVTWPVGLALFIIWAVIVVLSPLTIIAPLLIPTAAAIRGYAGAYRHWASRALGVAVVRLERRGQQRRNLAGVLLAPLRDPATWREWCWLLVNATAGFVLALLPVVFIAGAVFYLCYPFLYAITPQEAFGEVLGVYELHSVTEAWLVTPLGGVCLVIWYGISRSFPLANAAIIRAMLGSHARTVRA